MQYPMSRWVRDAGVIGIFSDDGGDDAWILSDPQVAKQFTQKLKPCCESMDPSGYYRQVDEDGGA
jgi:hypothetical protein